MRLNKFIANATGMSRRAADQAISDGRITIDGQPAHTGQIVEPETDVTLDGTKLHASEHQTIMLNKPVGYVCSRDGQGNKTIYDLVPPHYHHLKPIGRLDKDSSGLILLTNDGQLAHNFTHPSFQKSKLYEVTLNKPLNAGDQQAIKDGIQLEDGVSTFDDLKQLHTNKEWAVTMHEGRNRQIRRTFEALGYSVTHLHRTHFGPYKLHDLATGNFIVQT